MLVLGLGSGRRGVFLASRGLFRRGGLSDGATRAAVVTDTIDSRIVIDDGGVVGVVDHCRVDVCHSRVVAIHAAVPRPADEPNPGVPEAVVNSTIEADVRSPVAGVPRIDAASPAPIARRPQQADRRR